MRISEDGTPVEVMLLSLCMTRRSAAAFEPLRFNLLICTFACMHLRMHAPSLPSQKFPTIVQCRYNGVVQGLNVQLADAHTKIEEQEAREKSKVRKRPQTIVAL